MRGVSFSVRRERVAIVGESGSGKTVTALAALRLLPPTARVEADALVFGTHDLRLASDRLMSSVRGAGIALIPQDSQRALDPTMVIGDQISEAYLAHNRASKSEGRERALAMLERLSVQNPSRVYRHYPYELSGGMSQRVVIAMMLICRPQLIIADEPTSALDIATRNQVLAILDNYTATSGAGLLIITHDLRLASKFCDRILVMYSGCVIEECLAKDLHLANHPYTLGLLDSMPRIDQVCSRLPVLQRDPAWLQENQR